MHLEDRDLEDRNTRLLAVGVDTADSRDALGVVPREHLPDHPRANEDRLFAPLGRDPDALRPLEREDLGRSLLAYVPRSATGRGEEEEEQCRGAAEMDGARPARSVGLHDRQAPVGGAGPANMGGSGCGDKQATGRGRRRARGDAALGMRLDPPS